MWKAGRAVGGRYVLGDRIGAGASAEVWRAFDATLRAVVAIKLLVFTRKLPAQKVERGSCATARSG